MVEEQLRRRGIADERVLAAMALVPRELFVPGQVRDRAYDDAALPIGVSFLARLAERYLESRRG